MRPRYMLVNGSLESLDSSESVATLPLYRAVEEDMAPPVYGEEDYAQIEAEDELPVYESIVIVGEGEI